MTSETIVCAYCDYSKDIPIDKLPKKQVDITCPKCKNQFSYNPRNEIDYVTNENMTQKVETPAASNLASCPMCKEPIQEGAYKCKNCGGNINNADITNELNKYSTFVDITCLECGYKGKMGIIKRSYPWFVSLWIIIPTILVYGIGFIVLFFRFLYRHYYVFCPQCKKTLLAKGAIPC